MTLTRPTTEQTYVAGESTATPWVEAVERLKQTDSWWLATVQPNGHPRVVPVLAVWTDGGLHFAEKAFGFPTGGSLTPTRWRFLREITAARLENGIAKRRHTMNARKGVRCDAQQNPCRSGEPSHDCQVSPL